MAGRGQQQPWDRIGIRRIDLGCDLARNFTLIADFPGWTGEVVADDAAAFIVEFRLWSFQNPRIFAIGASLTNVDLGPGGVGGEDELSVSRRHDRIWHDGRRNGLSECGWNCRKQNDKRKQLGAHGGAV